MAKHTFGIIQIAAEEVRTDPTYFFDNQNRPDGSGLVVQLTIEGAAFFAMRVANILFRAATRCCFRMRRRVCMAILRPPPSRTAINI